jgi:phosphohistidine phosphatase
MLLLLIRHAEARNRDPERWPDDSRRPLVNRGRKRHRRMSRRLRRGKLVPHVLLSSPWDRAWETAVITHEVTRCPAPVATPALARSPDLRTIFRAVGRHDDDTIVGLVGHEPWMSELASLLLVGDGAELDVDFPKSGVMGIRAERLAAGAGALFMMWRPRP